MTMMRPAQSTLNREACRDKPMYRDVSDILKRAPPALAARTPKPPPASARAHLCPVRFRCYTPGIAPGKGVTGTRETNDTTPTTKRTALRTAWRANTRKG